MNVLRAPFLFLLVRFPGRAAYVYIFPLAAAAALVTFVLKVGRNVPIAGTSGLLDKLSTIMPISGGFFIAALTVILTTNNPVMQGQFSGSTKPYLSSDGEPMNRQRFLALMFGYLSFSAFAITIIIISLSLFAPPIRYAFSIEAWMVCKMITVFGLTFWCSQMFTCSLIGLYYLTDRLYRSNEVATFRDSLPPR